MSTFCNITSNYKNIVVNFFHFNSQTDVCYIIPYCFKQHLNKSDLIGCINYFLERLNRFSFADRIKQGFVLDKFKYYELSVYLHGILQFYVVYMGMNPIRELYVTRFSHLPHEILKPEPEKQTLTIECALLHRYNGEAFYVCMTQDPLCSPTFEGLKKQVCEMYLKHISDFTFILK